MHDVGVLPGTTQSIAQKVDASGRVLGVSFNLDANGFWTNIRAFLYQNGALLGLTPYTHPAGVTPLFLPDGRILCHVPLTQDYPAWVDENNAVHTISLGSSHTLSYVSNSQIVGEANDAGGVPHAFIYHDGITQDLGVPPGKFGSRSDAANASRHVVGSSFNQILLGSNPRRVDQQAYFYDGTMMQDIPLLPGFAENVAYRIDANDRVLGYAFNNDESGFSISQNAYLYHQGTVVNLTPTTNRTAGANFLSDGRILSSSSTFSSRQTSTLGATRATLSTRSLWEGSTVRGRNQTVR